MSIFLALKIFFRIVYLLLVLRFILNFKQKSRFQVVTIGNKNFFKDIINSLTNFMVKPFSGMLRLNVDVSPILVIGLSVYFVEPFVINLMAYALKMVVQFY